MNFRVKLTAEAVRNQNEIADWIAPNSIEGAMRWLECNVQFVSGCDCIAMRQLEDGLYSIQLSIRSPERPAKSQALLSAGRN